MLFNEYPDVLHEPINYKNLDEIEEYWTKYEGTYADIQVNSTKIWRAVTASSSSLTANTTRVLLFLCLGQFDEDTASG